MDERKSALIFKALGDENRIRILKFLGNGEKCACKLLETLEISQPTLSHHMRILCDSGIVSGRKEGKWMHYSISPEGAARARQLLQELTTVSLPPANPVSVPREALSWVRVFSCGCESCLKMLDRTRMAVRGVGLSIEVEHVTDVDTILSKGVMRLPALVLNGKVTSAGKLLAQEEIEDLLTRLEG